MMNNERFPVDGFLFIKHAFDKRYLCIGDTTLSYKKQGRFARKTLFFK